MKANAKKLVIGLVGGLVLLVGIALLILPGPAFLVIPAGLAILATEFEWARRASERVKTWLKEKRENHRQRKRQRQVISA